MSYFHQTCQYFDKDVKKMTPFIAEIAQKLTKKSEKNLSPPRKLMLALFRLYSQQQGEKCDRCLNSEF